MQCSSCFQRPCCSVAPFYYVAGVPSFWCTCYCYPYFFTGFPTYARVPALAGYCCWCYCRRPCCWPVAGTVSGVLAVTGVLVVAGISAVGSWPLGCWPLCYFYFHVVVVVPAVADVPAALGIPVVADVSIDPSSSQLVTLPIVLNTKLQHIRLLYHRNIAFSLIIILL